MGTRNNQYTKEKGCKIPGPHPFLISLRLLKFKVWRPCGVPYAALFNRAAAMFPGRAGAGMGLVNMLGIVMRLVGAPAVGKIADWTGSFQASFVALAAFNAAVLTVAGFIRK